MRFGRLHPRSILRSWIRLAALCALPLAASAAGLQSIQITPRSPVVVDGSVERFSAIGTFQDGTVGILGSTTLAAGGNHACVVAGDGSARCWGQNGAGQLGNGGSSNAFTPISVPIDKVTALSGGFQHTCALRSGGTVQCWGRGGEGQLGNGLATPSPLPVIVSGLLGQTAIAVGAGFLHSCALFSGGTIRCWGENGDGQLGDGTTTDSRTPVGVRDIANAIGLAVGGNNSCALLEDGEVKCWGANNAGQLGNGGGPASPTPVSVSGITDAVSIAAGFDYHCALLSAGSAKCWGRGLDGQLGDGGRANSALPVDVRLGNGDRAVALTAGIGHACALLSTGLAQCWGNNGNGQLGNGSVIGSFPTPALVNGLGNAIAIAAGFAHTCALQVNGAVRCWGLNDSGQLGNGSSVQRTGTPGAVNGTALNIDAGGDHSCAIGRSGTVTCWGDNFYGQLGQGSGSSAQPVTVSGIHDVVDLALGYDHSCAIQSDGEGWCWGRNELGQLGINSTTPPQTAVATRLPLLGSATAIAAGAHHTCAVVDGGEVQCWGRDTVGQLAYVNGTNVIVTFPSKVTGISNAVAITAGLEHTCTLLSSGVVLCWGRGDEGQLGNGSTSNSSTPVTVRSITNATAISAGNSHTCARLADGQIRCWGRGDEGQLGNGLTADSSVPVDTINDSGASDVSAGGMHSCMRAGGFVRCWGRGELGQIGSGAFGNRPDPQTVSGIGTAIALDAGLNHACAVLASGEVRCWGSNGLGQLGKLGSSSSALPVTASGLNMEGVALSWASSSPNVFIAMSGSARFSGTGVASVTGRYGAISRGTLLTVAEDGDSDGVADPIDVCPAFPDPDQSDADGNGIGDLCECGDQNGDGRVDVADLVAINLAIFDPALASPLCDTNEDGRCDVGDIVGANAKIFGSPAHCSRYPSQS